MAPRVDGPTVPPPIVGRNAAQDRLDIEAALDADIEGGATSQGADANNFAATSTLRMVPILVPELAEASGSVSASPQQKTFALVGFDLDGEPR